MWTDFIQFSRASVSSNLNLALDLSEDRSLSAVN
jgi:hypothetical protein